MTTAPPQKNTVKILTITEEQQGQRLDNFLMTRLKGLPKSHLYRILRKGEVRVNKGRVKPDYRLQVGDAVRIPPLRLSPPSPVYVPSQNVRTLLTDAILYEDKNILIINKPAGMAVHGGSGVNFGVIEALRQMRPEAKFLELAHRLDRDTSGCLVLAKKASILKEIHELLRSGKVDKRYQALVKGYWPKHLHEVDAPLQKFQLRSGERMVNVNVEGKASLTEFHVLKRFASATLVEARLHTGRTHQIRVHTAHVEHPIVGDEKYGDKDFNKQMHSLGCKGLCLHSCSVEFVLPSTGQTIKAQAEMEDKMKQFLVKLS